MPSVEGNDPRDAAEAAELASQEAPDVRRLNDPADAEAREAFAELAALERRHAALRGLSTPEPPAIRWTAPLTCAHRQHAPATHLLVADLAVVGRVLNLVCEGCGQQGTRDAVKISARGRSVWLFALIPERTT